MVLKGHIIDIKPETIYEDVAYENNVIVEFKNGIKISLFYPRKIVKEELLGKDANFNVRVYLASSIEKIDISNLEIKSLYDAAPEMTSHADIRGRIDSIAPCVHKPNDTCAVLNVGVGSIDLELDQRGLNLLLHGGHSVMQFNAGDFVCIKGAWLFTDDIEVIE